MVFLMGRKFFVMGIVVMVMLLLVGCGTTPVDRSGETPEETVTNALNAIKQLNEEKIEKYFSDDPIAILRGEEEELRKPYVENMSFEIISSSVDGDSATVKVAITNIDMGMIFGEYFGQVLSVEEGLTNEEMDQIFFYLLKRPDNEMVTITANVELTNSASAGGWIINLDEDFKNAVFGGIGNLFGF